MSFPEAEQCQLHSDEVLEFWRFQQRPELVDMHSSNIPKFDRDPLFIDMQNERFMTLTASEENLSVEALAQFAHATKRYMAVIKKHAPNAIFETLDHEKNVRALALQDPLYMTFIMAAYESTLEDAAEREA